MQATRSKDTRKTKEHIPQAPCQTFYNWDIIKSCPILQMKELRLGEAQGYISFLQSLDSGARGLEFQSRLLDHLVI